MKRTQSFLIAAVALMFLATSFAVVVSNIENGTDGAGQEVLGAPSYTWYGDGSAATFTISNADDLAGLAEIVNGTVPGGDPTQFDFNGKTITLANDIDLSAYNKSNAAFNGGKGWRPIGDSSTNVFKGYFDGNGKKITGLVADNDVNYTGLFGHLAGNVYMLKVEGADVKGTSYVGGIAGLVNATGATIIDCCTTGTVTGSGNAVGGIAGRVDTGTIRGCYSTANVAGSFYVAGIVGSADAGADMMYCYSTGRIAATNNCVGGIAGSSSGTILNCYSTSEVTAAGSSVGGIVGLTANSSSTTNSAALNSKVEGNTNVGKVAGSVGSASTCSGNKAFDNIVMVRPGGIGDGNDGDTAVTAEDIWADSRIGLFVTTPWPMSAPQSGKMPGIEPSGGPWDTPPHLLPAAVRTITVNNDGHGTASADRLVAMPGTTITLTKTPTSGYQFKEWVVTSGTVTIASDQFTMPSTNVVVRADFELIPVPPTTYTVTFSVAGGAGTLDAAVGSTALISPAPVEEGSNVAFTAAPAIGYRVKEWKVNSTVVPGNTSTAHTVSGLSANTTVTVEFELIPTPPITYCTVTFGVTGGHGTLGARLGSATLTSPEDVPEGSYIVFTAAPDSGYRIKAWYRDGIHEAGVGTDNPVSITVGEDVNFTVEFELIPVTPDPPVTTDSADDGLPIALIAGIIVGVAIAGFAAYWFLVRKP